MEVLGRKFPSFLVLSLLNPYEGASQITGYFWCANILENSVWIAIETHQGLSGDPNDPRNRSLGPPESVPRPLVPLKRLAGTIKSIIRIFLQLAGVLYTVYGSPSYLSSQSLFCPISPCLCVSLSNSFCTYANQIGQLVKQSFPKKVRLSS